MIYRTDPMEIVSELYNNVHDLINTLCNDNKSFTNLEHRFAAQLSTKKGQGSTVHLPESIYALLLRLNTGVDESQRVAVLSAATSAYLSAQVWANHTVTSSRTLRRGTTRATATNNAASF